MSRYTLPNNILILACSLHDNSKFGPTFAKNRIGAAKTIIKNSDSNVYVVGTKEECGEFIREINKGHPTRKTHAIETSPHTDGNLLQIKEFIDDGKLARNVAVSTSGLHCMRTLLKMEKHELHLPIIPAESIYMHGNLFKSYKKISSQHVCMAGKELLKVIEMLALSLAKGDDTKLLFEHFAYFQKDIDQMRKTTGEEKETLFESLVKNYGGTPLAKRTAYEVSGCAATLNGSYVPNI